MRGQVTFEFITTIVFILAIFIVGMAIFQSRLEMNSNFSQKWAVQNLAYKVARNIDNANLLDNNASITDIIYFDRQDFVPSVFGNALTFYKEDLFVDAPLSTSNVSFLVTDFNGPIIFKKINGMVVVGYS